MSKELLTYSTLLAFGILFALLFKEVPKDNADLLKTLSLLVFGFFFGAAYTKGVQPNSSTITTEKLENKSPAGISPNGPAA